MFKRMVIIIVYLVVISLSISIAGDYSNSDFDIYSSQETYKLRGKWEEKGSKPTEQQKTKKTYESVFREYDRGIKVLEQLNKKINELEQEIGQNNLKINEAENLLREARKKNNKKAEAVINEAIQNLKEAKKKNTEMLSSVQIEREKLMKSLDNLYKTLKDLALKEEKVPPYFSGDISPVNCEVILEGKDKEKCYCPFPNRPPLCFDSKEEKEAYIKASTEKRTYNCYWKAEIIGTSFNTLETDGSYWGQHSTYEEAWKACQEDAKKSIERGGFKIIKILNFECSCQ